ncbi:dynamin family protein [Pseudonocardia hierapolitana]|uniref:Dynamin family protein n=1 Tax=Pseudonocardia hierapolitana TaxID=1128676 RepID=A0A561SY45_9PSEU|nr:dynamin family protein [Pseudonocardia hierapolitana]TWF79790.1 dynamin family protein [Pseudonocardia hierapolitana]
MTAVAGGIGPADLLAVDRLRERLAAEARRVQRDDLIRLLDDLPALDEAGSMRVVVVGETKRGKSMLLNTLIGRPHLSPVGVDVTTSCWMEVAYGEREEAEVAIANPASPGEPIRRLCELHEVERYVALAEVTEPVIGVQVRVPSPVLRGLTIVDTPGVGGLEAGHSRTTLAVLRTADALLFVCDSKQPVSEPEIAFLAEAARRVPTVVVAVTKCDINPEFEEIVEATREIVAGTPGLESAPVLPVASPLADRATELADARRAQRMLEISGIPPLLDNLRRCSAAGAAAVRFENAARVLAEVCRALRGRSDKVLDLLEGNADRERDVQADIVALRKVLDDAPRLRVVVHQSLDRLHHEPAEAFDVAIEELRRRYHSLAEKGSAALLPNLASRLIGDMTAAAVAALAQTARHCTRIVADLMRQLGGADRWPVTSTTAPAGFAIGLEPPDPSTRQDGVDLPAAADLFTNLVQIFAGPIVASAAIGGPAAVAVSMVLAVGVGWVKAKSGAEQERRASLAAWVDDAAADARARFRREIDSRVREAERRVARVLPALVAAREAELTRLSDELRRVRSDAAEFGAALEERRAVAEGLRDVEREVGALVSRAQEVRRA